jgi:hypothetical protein
MSKTDREFEKVDREFGKADRAVTRAAAAIERAVTSMLATTRPLECVARDYVIERLIDDLLRRNPEAMDYLNEKEGEATMALANTLMDWRDMKVDR